MLIFRLGFMASAIVSLFCVLPKAATAHEFLYVYTTSKETQWRLRGAAPNDTLGELVEFEILNKIEKTRETNRLTHSTANRLITFFVDQGLRIFSAMAQLQQGQFPRTPERPFDLKSIKFIRDTETTLIVELEVQGKLPLSQSEEPFSYHDLVRAGAKIASDGQFQLRIQLGATFEKGTWEELTRGKYVKIVFDEEGFKTWNRVHRSAVTPQLNGLATGYDMPALATNPYRDHSIATDRNLFAGCLHSLAFLSNFRMLARMKILLPVPSE